MLEFSENLKNTMYQGTQGVFVREFPVATSRCDAEGKLSVTQIFNMFQDMAAEHAQYLGIGGANMFARGIFWLTIRTRIRVYKRPYLMDAPVVIQTWLGEYKDTDLRTDRYYRMLCKGEVVAEGRTEWGVLSLEKKSIVRVGESGMPKVELYPDKVLTEPFRRFRTKPEEGELLFDYTVNMGDIDVGMHMNNCAYPRSVMNTFTVAEMKEHPVTEMEVCYRNACYEGEKLTIARRKTEEGWQFVIRKEDGSEASMGVILTR